jgi:hypothetical protein
MPGRVIERYVAFCQATDEPWLTHEYRDLKTRLGGIVESFFENLTPSEKELFAATTVVGNLLADLQNAEQQHKAKSKSRKASAALKPFIAGVEQYASALDVIANTSSEFLSPLWGCF